MIADCDGHTGVGSSQHPCLPMVVTSWNCNDLEWLVPCTCGAA
jgi:hypothetical protein